MTRISVTRKIENYLETSLSESASLEGFRRKAETSEIQHKLIFATGVHGKRRGNGDVPGGNLRGLHCLREHKRTEMF